MRCMKKLLLLSLAWVWLIPVAMAQQLVSGKVTDYSTGDPLPGVNIIIQGTTTGTVTDMDGNYSLEVSGSESVLSFSFIGYETENVTVGGQATINIALMPDLTSLEEIVVVGYGTQRKALNTGATLQVKGEDIQKLSTTSPLQALQGQAAGVQISSTSGQPGEGMKVVIRGLGTIGNAGPLYVVDGVLTGDVSYLNSSDIQSIDVLKDAASAAIYGSQAANGVVLITTRQGTKGQAPRITLDAYYGVQNVARKANMLNAKEYAAMRNEAAVNSGKLPVFTNEDIAAMGPGTNWMDEMFVKDAVTQNYSIGFQGGSALSTYSSSLSYTSQEGIVGGKNLSNYERYNFRFNSEHSLYNDVITFGQHLTYSSVNRNGIGVGNQYNNSLRGAFNTSPFVPMYDEDGNFYDNSDAAAPYTNTEANPYAQMVYSNQNENNEQKLLGDIYLVVEPIKDLKFRTSLGLDYYANEGHSFTPIYQLSVYAHNDFTRVNQNMGKGRSLLWDNLLSYGFDLNQEHRFDVMLGSSAYQFYGTSIWGSNRDLIFSDLEHSWLSNATNTDGTGISLGGAPAAEDKRMSYFGRLNYNFNETYLINATFRADGSSRFAQGNRWGYFPSVSVGWVMSNEGFLSSQSWLNFFKLRGSWGQVGNQNIAAFQYLAPVTFANTNYIFGNEEGVLTPGAFPERLGNPDLIWETSEQLNIGFDARLLDGRLNVNFDWYDKNTKDWLIVAPILAIAGADAPFINGGDVNNRGVELVLSYSDRVGDFNYSITANGAYNKNRIGNIPTNDGIIHGSSNQLFDNSVEFYRAQGGHPIGFFWGYQTNGIFQTKQEVANYTSGEGQRIQPNARPGDVRFVDQNEDGVINELDKVNIGDPNPDYTFGLSFSADYKGFDFSFLASGVAGNQLVQSYRNHTNAYANYTTAILDRWHGPGSSNTIPRVTEDARNWTEFSDLYIHDGDFLRISNVTLGYDLSNLIRKDFVSKVRVYASALNLYTFTKYEGMDPEVGYGIDNGSSGVDLGYYPRPRTYMVGLNVTF